MTLTQLAALLSVWVAAITSPGPDTVQLTRLAANSRRKAVLGALGIMVGNTLWIVLSLAGMSALLAARPSLTHLLEIAGGVVLCWMGQGAIRGGVAARKTHQATTATAQPEAQPAPAARPINDQQAFRLGLVTNLSNPKAIIFFGAIFAQFLSPDMGAAWTVALALILITTGLMWFVGFAVAANLIAAPLARFAPIIDILAGIIFLAVGITLVATGIHAMI
ncbi:LysE family transporter [Corynebacterium aquilae]|uniref:Threonine transporter n=1 Tax=Corynebacterium aquilae DSM 44791 TaxID=1431546 RepID=A0A1L7CD76_9CORY|nr:LysE family transporter [Corynebacterium aquilae]APT83791.1 hypothetical protein CAQU_00340 [Corynebacterium aquilae DSM 44791]